MFLIQASYTTESGDYHTYYHHHLTSLGVMEGEAATVKALIDKLNRGFRPWVTFTMTEIGSLAGLADIAKAAESLATETFAFNFSNKFSERPEAKAA